MSTKIATAFLDRVQRSGLVSEDEMPQVRKSLDTRGVDLGSAGTIADALVDMGVLTRWQADKVLEGKHKGFFLGAYRLLRPLGKGGMGAVFLAQHEMMRRQCAIKVLPHSQIKEGSSVLKRFYVEAQAVASLDHQNIVRAYDVNREAKDGKEIHYLVMEYVEGHDLQNLVQEQGVMDYVKAAEYLRQTANGLAHAHENGLVHRDIKPANLLVDKKGVVKVLDLGLARFFDDSGQASLTTAHNETVLGTADYLSPEQALNSHTVDCRTDIYSLGCTAYFMLTGHPPFPEGTVAQRLVAHQVKMPPPITVERRDAPADLAAIIEKMMAKNADDRFQNAEELSAVLARWLIAHGGDDWKRQHSEIVGDKTLMTLLSNREPTRAISGSMSETELELVPLDDDDDDPEHVVMSRSPSASKPGKPKSGKSKSGRSKSGDRKAGKSSTRGKSAATAGDADQPASRVDGKQSDGSDAGQFARESPSLEGVGDVSLLPSLHDELEPLANSEGVDLASLDHNDMLGSLDERDLMGTVGADNPRGAMDSSLQQVVLSSSGSSASKSHRRGDSGTATPEAASGNSIWLPILIGSGGGLVLVLIILAIISMSTKPDATEYVRGPDGANEQSEETLVPDEVPGEVSPADDSPEVPAVEDAEQSADQSDVRKPAVPPETQPAEVEKPAIDSAEPSKPAAEPKRKKSRTAEPGDSQTSPDPKPDVPPKAEVAVAKAEESQSSDTEDEPVSEPPKKQLTPQQRFAAITGFKATLVLTINGKPTQGGKPTPMTQFFQNVLAAAEREATVTAEKCGLTIGSDYEPLLVLVLNAQTQGQAAILTMHGKMLVPDEAGDADKAVEVWAHDEELTTFTSRANLTTVYNVAREGVGKFFNAFRRAYEEATKSAGNP